MCQHYVKHWGASGEQNQQELEKGYQFRSAEPQSLDSFDNMLLRQLG